MPLMGRFSKENIHLHVHVYKHTHIRSSSGSLLQRKFRFSIGFISEGLKIKTPLQGK